MVEIRIDGKLYVLKSHDHLTTCIIRLIQSASVDVGEYLCDYFSRGGGCEDGMFESMANIMGDAWLIENGIDYIPYNLL